MKAQPVKVGQKTQARTDPNHSSPDHSSPGQVKLGADKRDGSMSLAPGTPESSAALDAQAPSSPLKKPWSYTFRDRLLRPFGFLIVVSLSLIQQLSGHGSVNPWFWYLFVPVVAGYLATLFPWGSLELGWRTAVLGVWAILAGMLYGIAEGSLAMIFGFIAAEVIGERLASSRRAVALAFVLSVCALGTVWFLQQDQSRVYDSPIWLAAVVGLPVYIGLARRNSREAYLQARVAYQQAQRAIAAESAAAKLTERSRLAREVHDVVGHTLSGVALQLDLAEALHEKGRHREAEVPIHQARALAASGLRETKRAVAAWRETPQSLSTLPTLPEALRALTETDGIAVSVNGSRTSTSTGSSVSPASVASTAGFIGFSGRSELPAPQRQAFIRITQEAIANIRQHSPGAAAEVLLDFSAAAARLIIRNGPAPTSRVKRPRVAPAPEGEHGGETFDSGEERLGGAGLTGMAERLALFGGSFSAGPIDEGEFAGGWYVHAEVPR